MTASVPLAGAGAAEPAGGGLTLLVREECELCEQMGAALTALARRVALPQVATADVDSDPHWQRRYGLKVPVLLLDGTPVCRTRLDEAQLLAALRRRGDQL